MEVRMSRKERDRLKVVAAVAEGWLKQAEAAARASSSQSAQLNLQPGSGADLRLRP